MVHLVRSRHGDSGLVAVSLQPATAVERSRIAVPGRVRVVDGEVADRLARLVDAAVEHSRAGGQPVRLDLDTLVDRAGADVARRRG